MLTSLFLFWKNMSKSRRILIRHIWIQNNLSDGLISRWAILSIFNGWMTSQEGTTLTSLNIPSCHGYSSQIVTNKRSNRTFTETWWKTWAVMEQSNEFSISWKSMSQTMSNNCSMNTTSERIIHQVQLSLTTWSESGHFRSVRWPFRAVSSIVLTGFSGVMLDLGEMPPTRPQTFVNWCPKFIHYLKCLSTSIIMTMVLHKIS